MPESYEFRVFDDNMKRQFLLNQILEQEVQLFSLFVPNFFGKSDIV